jgi:phenylacetate-coenzyme A ligase PaaK-like adenylate-forming protein
MFETGIRQFRMALSMVWGRRLDTPNLGRLIDDLLATIEEFGEPGDAVDEQQLLGGPLADPAARREFAERALRRTARRLATASPFYERVFAAAGVEPGKLSPASLAKIPVTTKRDLIERQRDFVCTDVAPYLTTRTTGTTGRPAEIWLSRYEMELWPALNALAAVLRDELRPDDLLQVNMNSRAIAATHLAAATCRLARSGCRLLGVVPPQESLDGLTAGATLLSTYPSYLAELVTAARHRGLGPADFHLRRVMVGGEILSPSLARAASQTLGVPRITDPFTMTEVIPAAGQTCSRAHLHFDLNSSHTELLDLATGEPAEPGALGTLVITPYFPYRECMPVFRYDTRDVARRLPGEDTGCELAGAPAISQILGKADHLLRLASGEVITPRELVNAIEALPTQPWPARFRAQARDGRVLLTLPAAAIDGYGEVAARRHFREAGLALDLVIVGGDEAASLRPARSDLRETTFADRPTLVGA